MKFELSGRLVFEADNTQDAFLKLATHFEALAYGEESELPLVGTDIKIKLAGSKTPVPPPDAKRTTYRGK
jgi:hypothetical protein